MAFTSHEASCCRSCKGNATAEATNAPDVSRRIVSKVPVLPDLDVNSNAGPTHVSGGLHYSPVVTKTCILTKAYCLLGLQVMSMKCIMKTSKSFRGQIMPKDKYD